MSHIYNEESNVYLKIAATRGGAVVPPPPSETEARQGAPSPLSPGRGGSNKSWLTATQNVVIRYLTYQKGQPNPLREGT